MFKVVIVGKIVLLCLVSEFFINLCLIFKLMIRKNIVIRLLLIYSNSGLLIFSEVIFIDIGILRND